MRGGGVVITTGVSEPLDLKSAGVGASGGGAERATRGAGTLPIATALLLGAGGRERFGGGGGCRVARAICCTGTAGAARFGGGGGVACRRTGAGGGPGGGNTNFSSSSRG